MRNATQDFLFFAVAFTTIAVMLYACAGCGVFEDIGDIADVARDAKPVIEDGKDLAGELSSEPRDWWAIAETGAYVIGGIAAVIGGNEIRKRRKGAANS